ncbi:MAG TPA: catalase family peroxidase [Pirellulales bacterium]|jgi:catalase|nr:catalase family peroxidase [Pirellulales bacterium]
MPQTIEKKSAPADKLSQDLLKSFDDVFGLHPGFRPVHAKGLMCSGTFTPSAAAKQLTRAPQVARPSTNVIVRLSDFAGVPNVPDNHPEIASPRGMAIRFYLAEHVHSDIVGHSADGFPVRTGEEFLEFHRAVAASPSEAPHPTPVEAFVMSHPKALEFVQLPKPLPTSFARESFFAVSAFKFTNAEGASRFGRYRILPEAGNEYLTAEQAAKKSPNYLFEEWTERIGKGPIKYRILVQLAEAQDETADATIRWPADRKEVEFGVITLTQRVNDQEPEMRKIIFDPRPNVDGIEASADPLFEVRANLYLLSGRRRRAASAG